MDYTKNLIRFIVLITALLFLISVVDCIYKIKWKPLNNINILSDIIKKEPAKKVIPAIADSIKVIIDATSKKKLLQFFFAKQANRI